LLLSGHRGAGRNRRASDYWRSLEKHRFYLLRSGGRYWDRTSDHIDHVPQLVEIPTWTDHLWLWQISGIFLIFRTLFAHWWHSLVVRRII
jgi:hypothetical protein